MKGYPYMSARVSAKRAKLLDSSDYEDLLKMQPNEIARRLEEGEYRKDINELGARHDGVELVELALNRNLSRTLLHLREIAPSELERTINIYIRRYDITTIKRLLRWKRSDDGADIQDLLMPVGEFDLERLEELAEKEFDEIMDSIEFKDSEVDYQNYLEGKEELAEIETALDEAYFDELEILASEIGSPQFRKFIKKELEHETLRTVLRLKRYEFSEEEIRSTLFSEMKGLAEEVVRAEDLEEALEIVRREEEVEGERLEDIEHALEVKRLETALRAGSTEPLGLTSILGYIVAKMVEVKNLRMLIRAKEAGIQNLETIRSNLVRA